MARLPLHRALHPRLDELERLVAESAGHIHESSSKPPPLAGEPGERS